MHDITVAIFFIYKFYSRARCRYTDILRSFLVLKYDKTHSLSVLFCQFYGEKSTQYYVRSADSLSVLLSHLFIITMIIVFTIETEFP